MQAGTRPTATLTVTDAGVPPDLCRPAPGGRARGGRAPRGARCGHRARTGHVHRGSRAQRLPPGRDQLRGLGEREPRAASGRTAPRGRGSSAGVWDMPRGSVTPVSLSSAHVKPSRAGGRKLGALRLRGAPQGSASPCAGHRMQGTAREGAGLSPCGESVSQPCIKVAAPSAMRGACPPGWRVTARQGEAKPQRGVQPAHGLGLSVAVRGASGFPETPGVLGPLGRQVEGGGVNRGPESGSDTGSEGTFGVSRQDAGSQAGEARWRPEQLSRRRGKDERRAGSTGRGGGRERGMRGAREAGVCRGTRLRGGRVSRGPVRPASSRRETEPGPLREPRAARVTAASVR